MNDALNEIPVGDSGQDFLVDNSEKYVLHIDNFEGPLDLLWDLILRAKIDVTEIFISHITEQYIEYLKLMDKMNVRVASEFVAMASDLIYYKSKALIPGEDIEDEYFIPPLPPDLVQKLIEYKKFQMTSSRLRGMSELQSDRFQRNNFLTEVQGDEYLVSASLFDLLKAFAHILESEDEMEQGEIVFDEILVSDRIEYIAVLLLDQKQIFFRDIFSGRPGRAEIVASLLAILEMSKSKMLRLMQNKVFGDIILFRVQDPA